MSLRVKDNGEIGHKEPIGDPLKEFPLESASNSTNRKSKENAPKFQKKRNAQKEKIRHEIRKTKSLINHDRFFTR